MDFVRDMLNREYSLEYVSTKYGISEEDLLDEYLRRKRKYSKGELEEVMNEVYYV